MHVLLLKRQFWSYTTKGKTDHKIRQFGEIQDPIIPASQPPPIGTGIVSCSKRITSQHSVHDETSSQERSNDLA